MTTGQGAVLHGQEGIVGLASHCPCLTDTVVYPPTGSMA